MERFRVQNTFIIYCFELDMNLLDMNPAEAEQSKRFNAYETAA